MTRRLTMLVLLAISAVLAGHAQVTVGPTNPNRPVPANAVPLMLPPPPARLGEGTAAISGVVNDATTGRPVAGAIVTLGMDVPAAGQPLRPPPIARQTTDEKGRFVFRYLPKSDTYSLNAAALGYADGGYGKTPSTNVPLHVSVADGQWFDHASIDLWRPGGITGRVLDERGEPVVGVWVRVLKRILVAGRPQLAAGIVTTTDDRGAYRLGGLSPGTYLVHVPSIQMAFPASTPFDVLVPSGPFGPLGSGTLDPAIDVDAGTRLMVGKFITPPAGGGRPMTYPGAFYPGVAAAGQASVVELELGREAAAVDIRMEAVPGFRVSGTIDGPSDLLAKLSLRLLPIGSENLAAGAEAATSLADAKGNFTFINVPAGEYVIDARGSMAQYEIDGGGSRYTWPSPPGARTTGGSAASVPSGPPGTGLTTSRNDFGGAYWGQLSLSVADRDLSNITLPLRRAMRMSGRIVWEASGNQSPAARPLAVLEPANGSASLGQPTNTQRDDPSLFIFEGLMPGEYWIRFWSLGDAWAVKSITSGGRDYSTMPFDAAGGRDFGDVLVTMTDKVTSVTGSVLPADGTALTSAAIIAFPAASAQWTNFGFRPDRIKAVRLTNAGTFTISNLPAGEYLFVAVGDGQADAWQNPKFLEAAAAVATHVSLAWGETKSLSIRLTPVRVR